MTSNYVESRYGPRPLSLAAKLERRSKWSGECLIWTGGVDKDGYGKVWHERKTVRTNIAAWIAYHGERPPAGQQVNHHCDNPSCIRKEHLYLGTQLDNMRDRLARGRWAGGRPRRERVDV